MISFSQGLINGKMMDMSRVDVTAPLSATEIWEIENIVGMDHPFHLHGFQFQVLDRNGKPEKDRRWKDTVNVPKHETVRFVVKYNDYPGLWMFHCHILDHEDHGMMGSARSQINLRRKRDSTVTKSVPLARIDLCDARNCCMYTVERCEVRQHQQHARRTRLTGSDSAWPPPHH